MKNKFTKVAIIVSTIVAFYFISLSSFAQDSARIQPFKGYLYIQPNIGLTQYFGDLNEDDLYNQKMNLGGGLAMGWQFSRILGARGQFLIGNLTSENTVSNKTLDSKFWDVTGQLTLNINEIFNYNPNRFLNLYVFGGGGYISEDNTVNNTDGTLYQKGKNDGVTFPIGGGAAFRLAKSVDLNLEYGHRITGRDLELDFTGNGSKYDQYSFASVGLTIKFLSKDKDRDGVKDKVDKCPDLYGKVELAGCPDKDNDGIADKDDACPDVAGKPEFKGCPDTDGDGIIDSEDACPTEAGNKELMGCPDKDNDGIADKDDKCPDVAGKKELAGCPDRDGDGIADKDDACPDIKGLANLKGCPDADGDGIADKDDKCPDVPGIAANFGCPEVKGFEYYKVVYFNYDKSVLVTKYTKDLDEVVSIMKEQKDVRLSVEGFADAKGTDAYNLRLSEKRADYVISYLVKKGIAKDRLVKSFYGEGKPVGDNNTDEGRALNRRVEIRSIK